MPSATALVTMRTYAKREPAEEPFIGFGDPLFGDRSDLAAAEVTTRGIRVAQRAVVNTRNIKGLPNLPETRDELKQIALTLGADENSLFLGENASEVNVKGADLKNYKVVAFATHGLVAGDLDGLEQPALALTPPDEGTEENDGLLQMGEVLGLEMNADWVVLSACNTASGDKSLANEGLTGLTQAFFYAGSRALLVSLWPVESTSTQNLTTEGKEVFSYAHPIFWSAFIAVGEGGSN
jgi:CHAT domain-containing protein